jgi:hypothetical protein
VRRQSEPRRRIPWARLLALGLLLGWALAADGCRQARPTVNVSRQANLVQAAQLQIEQRVTGPQPRYVPLLAVDDPVVLSNLSTLLDVDLPLGPLADCLPRYRLNFVLTTGAVQVLDYYCDGQASFLHGQQDFWHGQQVQPPAAFDAAMRELLGRQPPALTMS